MWLTTKAAPCPAPSSFITALNSWPHLTAWAPPDWSDLEQSQSALQAANGWPWAVTRIHGAAGWRFVSPYVDQSPIDDDAVRFIDNPRALNIRAKLHAYLEYYQSVKGVLTRSVVLRREQLATCGAMPGQLYKGIRLEAFS